MLILPIKGRWFNMIKGGEKKEEYRDITPYYESRLGPHLGKEIDLILRNGYARTSPSVRITALVTKGTGRAEWGADPWKPCFVLKIRDVALLEPEIFVLEARKRKRCGGILTSAKAVRNGYGHVCYTKNKIDLEEKQKQISLFEE